MKTEAKISDQKSRIQYGFVMLGLLLPFVIISILALTHNPPADTTWQHVLRQNWQMPFFIMAILAGMVRRWAPFIMLINIGLFLWLDLYDRLPITNIFESLRGRDWSMIALGLSILVWIAFQRRSPEKV